MPEPIDLTNLDMWARGAPYDEFARLRRESPVAWHDEAPPNSGFWSVCGYSDIVAASRDVGTFSSARGISFEEPTDEDMAARRTITDTDGGCAGEGTVTASARSFSDYENSVGTGQIHLRFDRPAGGWSQ